jgi:hypothetical protein
MECVANKENTMSDLGKAVLFGVAGGASIILVFLGSVHHILVFIPYIVLMLAVTGWMFRQRISRFWSRVAIALTAFAVSTAIFWVFDAVRSPYTPILAAVLTGVARLLLIGAAASLVVAFLSGLSLNRPFDRTVLPRERAQSRS